ncbi:MAG: efflux RND transporter periplasmic adaptor subunit [Acidobacteriota bacterium]|nr:efflux RND transporter periplasmic adaptor subunit [Acidobacteriota bacterium]
MKILLKIGLPLAVLLLAVVGAWGLVASRPPIETRRPDVPLPTVRVTTVQPQTVKMNVRSQGTVEARTTSQLVPEVSGRVVSVSPTFRDGGFFSEEDVLMRVDPRDYEWTLTESRSRVAQAELRLAQEKASADVARREWQDIGEGDGSPLALRELQVAEAEAALAAARAALSQSERNLERTDVRAPYDGRVLEKDVDVGQFATRGVPVARIYAVDVAEIRLPVPDEDLAFLSLPFGYRAAAGGLGPEVTLAADFAGGRHTWRGRIVRTDAQIDPKTRLMNVVAEVRDPYGRRARSDRPPLAVGMFVEGEIEGREFEQIVVLPRVALRGRDEVLVLDDDDRLRFRDVELLRAEGDLVYVSAGLTQGERVCVSPLETVVDGMRVSPVDATSGAGEGGAS